MARVIDVMKRQIVSVGADDRLSTVEDIMTLGGVRHMPVVSGGKLVGVVSERDLLRASLSNLDVAGQDDRRAFLHAVVIRRVMSAPPIVIGPRATLKRAARTMADHKIGCLPVVADDGELIGILTETDVLLYIAHHWEPPPGED